MIIHGKHIAYKSHILNAFHKFCLVNIIQIHSYSVFIHAQWMLSHTKYRFILTNLEKYSSQMLQIVNVTATW
jgi:hypothetical protein